MSNHTAVVAIVVAAGLSLVSAGTAFAGVAVRVPEPGTLTLIGSGAVVLAVGAWWRNRK